MSTDTFVRRDRKSRVHQSLTLTLAERIIVEKMDIFFLAPIISLSHRGTTWLESRADSINVGWVHFFVS